MAEKAALLEDQLVTAGREAENSAVRLERSIGEVRDLAAQNEGSIKLVVKDTDARMKNALSNVDATLSKTARDMRDSFGNIDASIKKELATQVSTATYSAILDACRALGGLPMPAPATENSALREQTVVIKAQEEKLQKELRVVEDSTQDRLVKLGSSVSAVDGTQKTKYAELAKRADDAAKLSERQFKEHVGPPRNPARPSTVELRWAQCSDRMHDCCH